MDPNEFLGTEAKAMLSPHAQNSNLQAIADLAFLLPEESNIRQSIIELLLKAVLITETLECTGDSVIFLESFLRLHKKHQILLRRMLFDPQFASQIASTSASPELQSYRDGLESFNAIVES